MTTLATLKTRMLKDPEVRKAYDDLESKYAKARQNILVRMARNKREGNLTRRDGR